MLGIAHAFVTATLAAQTVTRLHNSASADSIRFDQAPLPGGAANVFRFLFSGVPRWIQIGGVVVGAIVAVVLGVMLWKRRSAIATWLTTRSRGTKIALGASTVLTLGIVGAAGGWSWNYMMHENDFCSSCHVMKSAFNRFGVSEHDKLECHACHQQSLLESSKEVYYWVLDRPEKIPKHAPVPNKICGTCHLQSQADSVWKRISATAGHQVHFNSDSSELKDVMCVKCHAKDVHAFKAVDLSCGQSGCHDKIEIRLGDMANQSALHCVTCHEFTRPVSESISVDSTRKAMVPARKECFTCHEMREKLEKRGLDKDPHKANCGICHNPHDQTKAGKAFESCATAGCHANPDTLTAFHRGLERHVLTDCGACHKPHSWKTESSRCIDCHKDVFQDRRTVRSRRRATEPAAEPNNAPFSRFEESPPFAGGPHDATPDAPNVWAALALAAPPSSAAPAARDSTRSARRFQPTQGRHSAADTAAFRHSRHRAVACESCHRTSSSHGAIAIKTPADCQSCHHASDARAGACAACHAPAELQSAYPVATTLRITGRAAPLTRTLQYLHPQHQTLACADCHGAGVPQSVTRTCAECHSGHHRAQATCTSCHEDSRSAHARSAHLGCASCHTSSFVASLPPSRPMCLACHREQSEHKPGQDCEVCHQTGWVKRGGAA